jgi:hypothetical protein
MVEFSGIDSLLEGGNAKGVFSGHAGASDSAAGGSPEFEVSPTTVIIWVKWFRETGRCMPKPWGRSLSPLKKHAGFLLALMIRRTWCSWTRPPPIIKWSG